MKNKVYAKAMNYKPLSESKVFVQLSLTSCISLMLLFSCDFGWESSLSPSPLSDPGFLLNFDLVSIICFLKLSLSPGASLLSISSLFSLRFRVGLCLYFNSG